MPNHRSSLRSAAILVALLLFSGCSSGPYVTPDWAKWGLGEQCQDKSITEFELDEDRPREEVTLRGGDQVSVKVSSPGGAQIEDCSGRFPVPAQGTIEYPYVGEMAITDLTLKQVEEKIAKELHGKVVRNPKVKAQIVTFAQRTVTLAGPFRKPGTYPLNPFKKQTLVILVLEYGGGFLGNADKHKITIRRRKQFRYEEIEVNWCEHIVKREKRIYIEPGDVIEVAEAEPFSVIGSVGRVLIDVPFPPKGLTIHDAIIAAGGPGKFADTSAVKIFRLTKEGERMEMPPVDFDDIERNVESSHNVPLAPGDKVKVIDTIY